MTGVLKEKVVVVTGATGGIGSAIVRAVGAAGGVPVIVHHGEAAAATALAESVGVGALVREVDVRDWDQVAGLVDDVLAERGRLDVLVNNAGIMAEVPFTEMTRADWDATMDVDLTGVFLCARHAAVPMLAAGGGAIVNVSSQLAFKGAAGYTAYCAAKAGVAGLTRALAREIGPTVRVTAIAPGPVASPMTDPYATDEWLAERTGPLVIGRLAEPEEIAASVVFLASEAGSLMHGQTLHANGGGVLA
ncbi:SDR family NAD(P)-dependent oxidoreductase [Occultella gossypii]|uniref:SDR family oxidoreductase n=1 Tax=Occultella gossypii TaxID=2800820 RepID=A0ABS7S8F4_9MICO|nr:SDR family oxidoreductase [Occultella gossypii]MBZ2195566.1 SDR family oxidoreductase [Occultella gossypii]